MGARATRSPGSFPVGTWPRSLNCQSPRRRVGDSRYLHDGPRPRSPVTQCRRARPRGRFRNPTPFVGISTRSKGVPRPFAPPHLLGAATPASPTGTALTATHRPLAQSTHALNPLGRRFPRCVSTKRFLRCSPSPRWQPSSSEPHHAPSTRWFGASGSPALSASVVVCSFEKTHSLPGSNAKPNSSLEYGSDNS